MKASQRLSSFSCSWLALALLFSAPPCRADEAADRAAAEALYELGQRLLRDGNYAEACPKLEASNALEPGVGTLLLLGDCLEKAGKLASGWASFKDAAALARAHGDTERLSIAETRAAALRPRLTYVLYRVSPDAQVSGFELRRGGSLIPQGSWGTPLPTDPGRYELVASAPEHEAWHVTVEVPAKLDGPLTVAVPALKAAHAASPTPGVGAGLAEPATGASKPSDQAGSSGSGQRVLGLVSLGVGAAVGIASGTLTYLAAKKNHDSKNHCRAGDVTVCTPSGLDERDSAKKLAMLATILGVTGGVFAVAGVTLFLSAPSGDEAQVTGLVVGVNGRF